MNELPHKQNRDETGKRYQLALAAGVVVLVAYAVTYLLTVSPVVVRAIGTVLGGS